MLYKFKVGHNVMEATRNICCMKDESAVEHSTVNEWFKKFHSASKNLHYQAMSDKPKSVDSEAALQAIEANLVSSTQRVSGELHISNSSVVVIFMISAKTSRAAK